VKIPHAVEVCGILARNSKFLLRKNNAEYITSICLRLGSSPSLKGRKDRARLRARSLRFATRTPERRT
jgi:hypothetical protein